MLASGLAGLNPMPKSLDDPARQPVGAMVRNRQVGLIAGVVKRHQDAGDRRNDHIGHDPLHIDVNGEKLFILSALRNLWLNPIKETAKTRSCASLSVFFNFIKAITECDAIFIFGWARKTA